MDILTKLYRFLNPQETLFDQLEAKLNRDANEIANLKNLIGLRPEPGSPGAIYVDLDGTLAHHEKWVAPEVIGEPIPAMMERVKKWVAEGKIVKIFTARYMEHHDFVRAWLKSHGLGQLEVTSIKGIDAYEFWDDRAVPVEMNTGRVMDVRRIYGLSEASEDQRAAAMDSEDPLLYNTIANCNKYLEENKALRGELEAVVDQRDKAKSATQALAEELVTVQEALADRAEVDRQIREIIWLAEPGSTIDAVKLLWDNLTKTRARVVELEAERNSHSSSTLAQYCGLACEILGKEPIVDGTWLGQLKALVKERDTLRAELEAVTARAEQAETERDDLRGELEVANQSVAVMDRHLQERDSELEAAQAEIERLTLDRDLWRKNSDLRESERDTLAARVKELEEEVARVRKLASEDSMALDEKLRTLSAELEAVTKMRDEAIEKWKSVDDALVKVTADRDQIQEQARRYKKDYHAALGEAQELRSQLAALRQPIPEHTARQLAERLCAEYHGWGGWDDMSHDKQAELVRAVQAVSWPACQPVDADAPLPAPETRPVEVGWSVTAEDFITWMDTQLGWASDRDDAEDIFKYLAAHAVLPVPAGVPSVEELTEIGLSAEVKAAAGGRSYRACSEAFATAIRNAVLASLPHTTPHEPTDAEVEALARVLILAVDGISELDECSAKQQDIWRNVARAAFKHFGRPAEKPIEPAQKCLSCGAPRETGRACTYCNPVPTQKMETCKCESLPHDVATGLDMVFGDGHHPLCTEVQRQTTPDQKEGA